jgi:hypothetical protein
MADDRWQMADSKSTTDDRFQPYRDLVIRPSAIDHRPSVAELGKK